MLFNKVVPEDSNLLDVSLPCPLLPFFHHQDILVCNSILSSRSPIVHIHPCQLAHEIKMHAQPLRYVRVLCV